MAKKSRKKARIPAKGFTHPARSRAREERVSEVMVAMTKPVFFPASSDARGAFWGADREFQAQVIKRRFQLSLSVFLLVNKWKISRGVAVQKGANSGFGALVRRI